MQTVPILNLTRNPLLIKNGEAVDARNIIVTKDQKAVRNEDGFSHIYTGDGTIIGSVEIPNGFVLFYRNPDKIIHIENDIVIKTISSYFLKFSINNPITGNYTYNSDGDLIIQFSEGVSGNNETRIINITKSNTVLTQEEVYNLDVIPNIVFPTITNNVKYGGSLLAGAYQVAIAYKIDDGIYTNYSILSDVIHVYPNINEHVKIGDVVNRYIHLYFENLDNRYKKFKVGILYKGEDTFEKYYETDDISTTSTSYKIFNTDSLANTSIEALTVPSISYIKDNAATSFYGRMYRGNVKTVDYTDLDSIMANVASKIKVGITYNPIFTSLEVDNNNDIRRYFKEGEYYVLYVGAFDYKGNLVNCYPIPHKDGDETEGIWANEDQTIKIHKIPYYTYSIMNINKVVANLNCTLPSNLSTLLGKHDSTITSFAFFYAEHNLYNSKILSQGYAIRDYVKNDFNDSQKYQGPFASRTNVRFYSLEHLFLKSRLSNASIYNHMKLYSFYNSDRVKDNGRRYLKIYPHPLMKTRENITVSKIEYVRNDNTIDSNIAGESYHRIITTKDQTDKIFGGNVSADFSESIYTNLDDTSTDDDTSFVEHNRTALIDLISKSDYFYNDVYNQKLVICSPIISKTKTLKTDLTGDFFYDNFTFRITGPIDSYRYGTEDIDLQDEDHVWKIVISIPLESRFNLRARYNGSNNYQKVYNVKTRTYTEVEDLIETPYANDNFINTDEGKGYSLSCHYRGYDYITYEKELDTKYHFNSRVIRSVVATSESKGIPWRTYNAKDYKDLSLNRGSIVALNSDENTIYMQQEYSVAFAAIRDKLASSDSGESFLGSSDVFDREPIEIMYDKTGYIGCSNRFSSIITPFGYVVVDDIRKNIYLIKYNQANKLNGLNVEEFFYDNFVENSVNPYSNNGICLLYDDIIKSLFITQNNEQRPFTIHYNFVHKNWLSFHDYTPKNYINNRKSRYVILGNNVYKKYADNKCIFGDDVIHQSSVTYVYSLDFETFKHIYAISWNTLVKNGIKLFYDKTFDKVMLYSDTQCTGLIHVNENIDWFDTESGVFKTDNWYFNHIEDIVINDKLPFMNEDGSLIDSNLNIDKDWFDKSDFLCKFAMIKFVYMNSFADIHTGLNVDKSVANSKQLDVTFNSFNVHAIKSLR